MTIEVFLVWVESIFFVISILVLLATCVAGVILFQRISQINELVELFDGQDRAAAGASRAGEQTTGHSGGVC